jgi:hypothetical protein
MSITNFEPAVSLIKIVNKVYKKIGSVRMKEMQELEP